MERIPFGISRLDTTLGGGAPRGSVVLLAGEAGAGAREFMYTSAVMNGVAHTDRELFSLHYGRQPPNAILPEEVHYLSFTDSEAQLRKNLELSMETELAEAGLAHINFQSLANEYFRNSSLPREWYVDEDSDRSLYPGEEQSLVNFTGDMLNNRAPDSLVVIDSLSDLVSATGEQLEWADIVYLVKGLRRVSQSWNSLILLHVDHEALTDTEEGQLVGSCTGTLRFDWSSGGSMLARTVVLQSFRGVLSQIDEDELVQFEADLGDSGFRISDVRKIR